jgi:prepilin-type N-terminal cleavage/methylation domain-containing protein
MINMFGQKYNKTQKGFTLIELLMGIGIFTIIATATLTVLFVTLRVSKKTDSLVQLRQSGNFTLSQVSRSIRFAKSLDYPTSCVAAVNSQSIIITSLEDNGQTTFSCTGGSNPSVASNSANLIDTSKYVVSDCSFKCTQSSLNEPPTIDFSFTLNTSNANSLMESGGSLGFQTSVTLRNYNQ